MVKHKGTENLIPQNKRTKDEQREIAKSGGIASGKARRAKKDRHERIQWLYGMMIKNKKMICNLEELGIEASDMDNETAADIRMILEAQKGNVHAWKSLKEEAYGPLSRDDKLTLTEKPVPFDPDLIEKFKKKYGE